MIVECIGARNTVMSALGVQNSRTAAADLSNLEARMEGKSIRDLDKTAMDSVIELAKQKIKDGQIDAAIEDLLLVLDKDPDQQECNSLLGAVLLGMKQSNLAEGFLYSAIQLSDWTDVVAIVNLAQSIGSNGEAELALKVLTKGLEKNKTKNKNAETSGVLSEAFGDTYQRLGKYSEAAEWFLMAAINHPKQITYWIKASTMNFPKDHQDLKIAENVLYEAVVSNPGNTDLLFYLGVVMHSTDRVNEAIVLYKESLAADTKNYETVGALATALHATGKYKQALEFYIVAEKFNKENHILLANYAMLLCSLDRKGDAQKLLERALRINSNSADVSKAIVECKFTLKQ